MNTIERTLKLFHSEPSLDRTSARVVRADGNTLILDRTIFYADSGGQVADTGSIDGIAVTAVRKCGGRPVKIERSGLDPVWVPDGTHFVHELDSPVTGIKPGDVVDLAVDLERRHRISRYHSAAHFLFAALAEGLERRGEARIWTEGCSITETQCRFDLANDVDGAMIEDVARRCNDRIATFGVIGMSPVDGHDDAFIWTSQDLVIPCGGTHVASTAALSPLRIVRRSKGRGKVRITGTFVDA